ncbi:hypothetical protein Lalb_Chr07g0189341 [Lupinus albus]|uniref:Uncharacterized protein n=1 Tax=Lupinus albus TaxID=3870 RepID=A0A6A4Q916_LUPAL|nr:hypothetical protein Lalb_Chr07g0189341 [Lupinus albus]
MGYKSDPSSCCRHVLKGSKAMNLGTNTALDNILIIGRVSTNLLLLSYFPN